MKQKIEDLDSEYWHFSQIVKISELLTAKQFEFSVTKWKLTSSSLVIIQLCKSLSYSKSGYVIFVDNFFISTRLFKALKVMSMKLAKQSKLEVNILKS
jgi:hypothetical protein